MHPDPESDIDTDSDCEYDPDDSALLEESNDVISRAAYKKLRKKIEEIEKSFMEKVKILEDRTSHLVRQNNTASNIVERRRDHSITLDSLENEDSGISVEQGGTMVHYPRDSYTFLALFSPIKDPFIFFFGITIFLFQVVIQASLVLSVTVRKLGSNDYIDGSDPIFPGDVELIVKIVQILSIMVHVTLADYSMDDLIKALNLFPNVYTAKDDDPLGGLLLSSCLRLTQGVCANAATFILIFTSLTAKEVILNFAAVNFLSGLDQTGFSSMIKGYFGPEMREKALEVLEERLPECVTKKKYPFLRSYVATFSIFAILTALGLSLVLVPQTNDAFLTEKFRLDLGGGTGLESFNGCYYHEELPFGTRFGGARPIYVSLKNKDARFAYCKTELKWYLLISDHSISCPTEEDKILAYSSITFSFDIKTIFADPWYLSGGAPLDANFLIDGVGVNEGCGKSTGDGSCDSVLNVEDFEYDGGDCCAATCEHPDCGLGAIKNKAFNTSLKTDGDGYQECSDPSMVNVSILVLNVTRREYFDFTVGRDGALRNSTPPILRFDCDGVNHLTIAIQEQMQDKEEVIKVRDGAKCEVLVGPGHKVDFSLLHSFIRDDSSEELNVPIFSGNVNKGSARRGNSHQFQVIPKCYFEKLFEHIDIDTIYVHNTTPQRRAIDYLLDDKSDTSTSNSECGNKFFIERYALTVGYLSAKYPSFDDLLSVEFSEEMKLHKAQCTWTFVKCVSGHVADFEFEYYASSGAIATELALLTELRELNFKGLAGTIPSELGMLTKLTKLRLDENELEGTIPAELGCLLNLKYVDLRGNLLSGTIPSELGKMLNLKYINFSRNKLKGTIPAVLGNLLNLSELILYINELTGTIPAEFGNLLNIEELDFDINKLTGTIPAEFGNLSSLKSIWFNTNELIGTIPTELGNLSNLTDAHINDNKLTGTIPTELGNLSNLMEAYLNDNKLTGTIPTEFGNLSNLMEAYLNDNKLTGTIPTEFGNLSNLTRVSLNGTGLTGNVDSIFCDNANFFSRDTSVYEYVHVDCENVMCTCCISSNWQLCNYNPTVSPLPSLSPSLSVRPSLSMRPSAVPTTSAAPSKSVAPTTPGANNCIDFENFENRDGDGCDWYEENDNEGCPNYGDMGRNDGVETGNNACCFCGGGGCSVCGGGKRVLNPEAEFEIVHQWGIKTRTCGEEEKRGLKKNWGCHSIEPGFDKVCKCGDI